MQRLLFTLLLLLASLPADLKALPDNATVVKQLFAQFGNFPFGKPTIRFHKRVIHDPASKLDEYIIEFKNDSFPRQTVYVHRDTSTPDARVLPL